jgi:hypothetical protein
MAWLELADATFDARYRQGYDSALANALANASDFLPGHAESDAVMDRLHAFLYFLEGLLPRAAEPDCAIALCDGIPRVARYVAEIGPDFLRADVLAQLLRLRIYANAANVLPIDAAAASREVAGLRRFQAKHDNPRIDGGFYFGARANEIIPHISPVPTVFAIQALDLWRHRSGADAPPVI